MIKLKTKCFELSYESEIKASIEGYLFDALHEIEEPGNIVKLTTEQVEGLISYVEKKHGDSAEVVSQLYTLCKNMGKNERLRISWS